MKILAFEKERPGATPEGFAPYLEAEARRARELHEAGLIRELYFRADRREAVLVLECDDASAAEAALATLPLVREGLITFDLMPLVPYDGFARLFREEPQKPEVR
jgi:muconolactone delta-isomerase